MALVIPEKFQYILRILGTNVDGKQKIQFAMTAISGVGRRYAAVCLKKAGVDPNQRAGELSEEEIDRVVKVIQAPLEYKVPLWMLNRQFDRVTGTNAQLVSNQIDQKAREDFDRIRKIKCHRGLRQMWGLRVRGQHTKTTGRRGKTVGVSKKKQP